MSSRTFLIGLAVLGLLFTSCAGEDDIDRTQVNRLPKSMFQGTWYIRSTVIGVPGTSAAAFVGYTGTMEKIRWEIQEDYLIARRAYEEVPGTDSAKKGNTLPEEYSENPVAVFPIKSHFDIKREYNASTGEQTNVVTENTSDRPWHERDWLRVDWSASKVDAQAFGGVTGNSQYNAVYFVQAHEDSDDAMRVIDNENNLINFEKLGTVTDNPLESWGQRINYFDMVGRFMLEPEKVLYQFEDGTSQNIPLCYFTLYAGQNFQTSSCGPTEVKVRTSFMKVGDRNFEPVPMPDREMGKFGYFRTERFTWDRKYGFTETGRIYLANVHNIWEKAYETNADGTYKLNDRGEQIPIPMEKRIPKPIVYHLTPDFPCEMVSVAQRTAESWNVAYRKAVAVAKGLLTHTMGETAKELATNIPTTPEQAPGEGLYVPKQMFKLHTNGWVQKNPGDDWSCDNLKYDKSQEVFKLGDLRFSTMAWIHDRQITGPLGYGPSSPDPETGEIVSGTAHVYGAALDTYAGSALDIVRALNNDLNIDNMLSGDYVKNYIDRNKPVIDPAKIPTDAAKLKGAQIRDLFLTDKMSAKLKSIQTKGLEIAPAGGYKRGIELLKGTGLEDYLLDEEIIKGMAPHLMQGQAIGPNDTLPKQVRDQLSPLNWSSSDAKRMDKIRRDRAAKKTIWLAEFADDSIQGLAMDVWQKFGQTKDYDGMWQYLREQIFRGVLEHEVGHTIGLRHNFSGSYDSVNYHNHYWHLREKPDAQGNGGLKVRNPLNANEALGFGEMFGQAMMTDEQKKGRMREYQYSTIMDYGNKFNSDIHGIGKWDEAAIMFAYTGYVEVFEKASADAKIVMRQRYSDCSPRYESIPNIAYAPVLEQWHYSSIWNLMGQTDGLVSRRFRKWADVKKEQDAATESCKSFVAGGKGDVVQFNQQHDGERDLEVPYMFCSDDYVGATVSCQLWDQGADPMEMAQNFIDNYYDYYFFNNYKRDRFGFDAYTVYSRIGGRYFSYLPNIYQHWLFRVGFYGLDDVTLENYWTLGTWQGFNLLMDVISRPEYGTYCKANEAGQCTPVGKRWSMVSMETTPTTEANRAVIPRGEGRRRYSRYDYDSGYYYQYQTIEAGHFWEFLAAIEMLTASTGTFAGVEIGSDFTRYLVPYFILFEDQLTSVFESIVTDNYEAYAPCIAANGQMFTRPAATLSLTNGDELDPATGQTVNAATQQCDVVDLANWFTLKFYALVQGMAEFRSLYSLRFADRQQVFRLGSGEENTPAPGPGMEVETCQDPVGGHIYGTIYDPTIPEGQEGGAVQLLRKCQLEAQNYLTLKQTSAPNSTTLMRARAELNDTIEWLNFMRGLYSVYGSNY